MNDRKGKFEETKNHGELPNLQDKTENIAEEMSMVSLHRRYLKLQSLKSLPYVRVNNIKFKLKKKIRHAKKNLLFREK